MTEIELRDLLQRTLKEDPQNYSKILELSSKLSNFDKENIRFTVDAAIINRLGAELVARQETAVSELVKNAYDADATSVIVSFIDTDKVGGTLIIEDNGVGMTLDQLTNGFMRLSSSDKVHNPISPNFKRKRSGQKGIGRFAVQRLGSKLTITTQTEQEDNAFEVSISWDEYERDVNLSSISNRIRSINKMKNGTTLKIEGVRDKWSEASIKRIYRYVTDIIQPFPLNNIDNKSFRDPGFKSIFRKSVDGKMTTLADDNIMVYNYALAEIDGWIDDSGIGIYTVKSKRLNIDSIGQIGDDPENDNIPFSLLKNVRFRAYYFVYNNNYIPKLHQSSIKRLAREKGGVRLYRNGFRVLPYAENNDDWLSLDKSVRTRTILPVHGNHNFFGFVELFDEDNTYNETSSREGLIENNAFKQLKNFLYRTIISGVIKVSEKRNTKITTSQKKDENGLYEQIDFKVNNIVRDVDKIQLLDEVDPVEFKIKMRKLKKDLEEMKLLHKREHEKTIKERAMLRVLGGIGLVIGQFIHEIRHHLNNMKFDIEYLTRKLNSNSDEFKRVNILKDNLSLFTSYTSYFDEVISQNVVRELVPIDVYNFSNKFWNNLKKRDCSDITFVKPINHGYYLYTVPMHLSEWSTILFNLFTNAEKAIRRAKVKGKIGIECGKTESYIYLEFSDNGDGISPENEKRIFDEFFTTSSPVSYNDLKIANEITGTGLGLKIVKDIVSSYKGYISVVAPKGEYNTTFRIEIPKAKDKQLEEYGV